MPLIVVADGKLCDWAMQACGVTSVWIDRVLRAEHRTLDEVLILSVNGCKDYYLVPKEGGV